MATASTTMPEVFVRKSSGLVRVMSPRSAFVYNVLTMGLIFPWTYLWAPAALPGGQLVWGILLAMVLEIPIALAYVWLSTALPRSGGDYVFQSRVLGGGIGFTLVFSGFVIWILQWVALSGWLLSSLGFAPLFLGLGAATGSSRLVDLATWFTTGTGIVIDEHRERPGGDADPRLRVQELRSAAAGHVDRDPRVVRDDARRPVHDGRGRRAEQAERVLGRDRRVRHLLPGLGDRRPGGRRQPEPGVQPGSNAARRADRLDVAPVGDVLGPAER